MSDIGDLLRSMPPEKRQALVSQLAGLGTMDEKQADISGQIEQARALQARPMARHSTGIGAALGGLGDILRTYGGMSGEERGRSQLADLLRQKSAGRESYLGAFADDAPAAPAAPPPAEQKAAEAARNWDMRGNQLDQWAALGYSPTSASSNSYADKVKRIKASLADAFPQDLSLFGF